VKADPSPTAAVDGFESTSLAALWFDLKPPADAALLVLCRHPKHRSVALWFERLVPFADPSYIGPPRCWRFAAGLFAPSEDLTRIGIQ
jgi:hypothetical protein